MVAAGPTGVFMYTPKAFRSINNANLNNFDIWDTDIDPACKANFNACTAQSDLCGCHAVVVVGYGTQATKDYWIIAKSWGTNWGKDGYARVLRGSNTLGIENVRAVRITDVNLTSVLPQQQKSGDTTVNVNVYTEEKKTANSDASTAGVIIFSILIPTMLLSFYCLAWPFDYTPYTPVPKENPIPVMVIKQQPQSINCHQRLL